MQVDRRAAVLGLGVGVLATGGLGPALADTKGDVAAAYKAWDAAFNKGDAKAVAAFYAPDAVFLPANHEVITGPAGVEKFFAGLLANGVTGHELKVIAVGDGGKIVYGTANWSAKGKDGKSIGGLATHVFERQAGGSMKLKVHTFN